MILIAYVQNLNPFQLPILSTFLAALPVLTLFYLLVMRGTIASLAGAIGAVVAIILASVAFQMPLSMSIEAFLYGAGFGLLPIGWTVFSAMLLYNTTVISGQFNLIRQSVASLSGDARIQAVLIGFSFGALMEGAAGAGSPVAICGAMLVGLGFPPLRAAVICLIANTSPVAYGGLGVPILTLAGTADLPADRLSIMAGHQLPLLSCILPLYMTKLICTWKQTFQIWPALLVAGGSFAGFQFVFSTFHAYFPQVILWPLTDIGGGIFSLIATGLFLHFWKLKTEWHFENGILVEVEKIGTNATQPETASTVEPVLRPLDNNINRSPSRWEYAKAWMPFVVMSILLMLGGLLRETENKRHRAKEGPKSIEILGLVQTRYDLPIPGLHQEVYRPERLRKILPNGERDANPEEAVFTLNWATAPGTPVFLAAILSMIFLRLSPSSIYAIFKQTIIQMKVPIPTIACMLGLSYVTRYAGMDAMLGVAFANTGFLYPFFAAILGWLGVFLTGTDAGSNALFGSLQKITATEIFQSGHITQLTLDQSQTLICTANSTGGVMGKMIDAQSICVATAGTNQVGSEGTIFRQVLGHSIFLASIVGILTFLQAYISPFTWMVPTKP